MGKNTNNTKKNNNGKIKESSIEEYVKSQFKNQKLEKVNSSELTPRPYDENRAKWNANNKIVDLYSKNASKDRELKDKYARTLIKILIAQLIVTYIIFGLAGASILKYDKFVLDIFISGSLLETFAIVKIIVENLFNNNLNDPLNIILKNSNSKENKKNTN